MLERGDRRLLSDSDRARLIDRYEREKIKPAVLAEEFGLKGWQIRNILWQHKTRHTRG